jgi:hypothetical protein
LRRPEGNITGFSVAEPSIAGKRLQLLKEAVPSLTRVAVIFNPETAATALSYISSIEAAAAALGVEAIKMPVRSAVDIVRGIDAFATTPNGGLLVLPPPPIPETIRQLVTQHVTFVGEAVLNAALLLLFVWTAGAFFRRSRWFPRVYIWEVLATVFAAPISGLWAAVTISMVTGQSIDELLKYSLDATELGRSTGAGVLGGLWILYLYKSKRVANTFVN